MKPGIDFLSSPMIGGGAADPQLDLGDERLPADGARVGQQRLAELERLGVLADGVLRLHLGQAPLELVDAARLHRVARARRRRLQRGHVGALLTGVRLRAARGASCTASLSGCSMTDASATAP